MVQVLDRLHIWIPPLVLAVAMLIAWESGKLIGGRLLRRAGAKPSKFDDASIALLGLLLAFAFGMSLAKYDQRRLAVVADGNAIGDFYNCASLLKEPVRSELRSVIRKYAQLRLDLTRSRLNESAIEHALAQFDRLHDQMIELVGQALSNGTPIAVSLTNTLNAVTSSQATRLAAFKDRLPSIIVLLLFACAILTTFLIGREQGRLDSPEIAGTLCFIVVVALTVYVTLDLNRPERGLIRASQEPIERLLSSMPK